MASDECWHDSLTARSLGNGKVRMTCDDCGDTEIIDISDELGLATDRL